MAVTLSSLAGAAAQFFDNNGVPLTGGLIYTYVAGTTTPAATYTSSTGLTAHTNPIVLNAAGRIATGEVWLTSGVDYKFIVQTALFVQLGSYDNIPSVNDFTSIYAALANTSNVALGDALVGFRQSDSSGNLSGAVGRTVHQKLQESVSVKDFGAVGDGVTDDASAIQTAIDAVGYGGQVFFPKGTYICKSTINIAPKSSTASGVMLVGETEQTVIKVGLLVFTYLFYVTGSQAQFKNLALSSFSNGANYGVYVDISNNSDIAFTIMNCKIVGFSYGILAKGQNYYIENNFFQNNTRNIVFADDGRNTSISSNYMLGGSVGVEFAKVTQQAEGVRIINNTFLLTSGNGSAVDIQAGLEISIIGNIFDQMGPNSTTVYVHPTAGEAVSSVKLIGNWIAAGQNAYGFFGSGNNNHIYFTNNTFVCNNGLPTLDAINLTDTNTYCLVGNRFLMTNLIPGSLDLKTSGVVNGSLFGNDSLVGNSPIFQNLVNGALNVTTEIRTTDNVEGKIFVFVDTAGTTVSWIQSGTGSPNGIVNAISGTLFMRTDGSVGNRLYVCQTGTTWLAVAGV